MKFRGSVLILLAVLVFPLDASSPEVVNSDEVLELLSEASKANRALMNYGRIRATVRHISYDEKGQKDREAEHEVRAVFKGENIRLDQKEQREGAKSEA